MVTAVQTLHARQGQSPHRTAQLHCRRQMVFHSTGHTADAFPKPVTNKRPTSWSGSSRARASGINLSGWAAATAASNIAVIRLHFSPDDITVFPKINYSFKCAFQIKPALHIRSNRTASLKRLTGKTLIKYGIFYAPHPRCADADQL